MTQNVGAVPSSVRSFGSARSEVGAGCSISAQRALRSTSSSRGPHDSDHGVCQLVYDVGDDKTALLGARAIEHVERESMRMVLRIKENYVVFPVPRDVVRQEVLAESAVRINDRDAGAGVPKSDAAIFVSSVLFPVPACPERAPCAWSAGVGQHDELRLSKKIICMGSDGGGVEHERVYLNTTSGGSNAAMCISR